MYKKEAVKCRRCGKSMDINIMHGLFSLETENNNVLCTECLEKNSIDVDTLRGDFIYLLSSDFDPAYKQISFNKILRSESFEMIENGPDYVIYPYTYYTGANRNKVIVPTIAKGQFINFKEYLETNDKNYLNSLLAKHSKNNNILQFTREDIVNYIEGVFLIKSSDLSKKSMVSAPNGDNLCSYLAYCDLINSYGVEVEELFPGSRIKGFIDSILRSLQLTTTDDVLKELFYSYEKSKECVEPKKKTKEIKYVGGGRVYRSSSSTTTVDTSNSWSY